MKMDISQQEVRTRRSDCGRLADSRSDFRLKFAGTSPNSLLITKHFMPLGSTRTIQLL